MPDLGTEESPTSEIETGSAVTADAGTTESVPSTDADAGTSSTPEKTDANAQAAAPDLGSVIRDALKPKEEPSASAQDTSKDPEAESDKGDKASPEKPEPTQEEKDKLLPFHKHPRWVELNTKLKELEPEASEFRAIKSYMSATKLSTSDVTEALQLTALLKADPAKARESIVAILDTIDKYVGNALPDDLKKDVESGAITEERAKELSQARAAKAVREASDAAAVTEAKAEDQRKAVAELSKGIQAGVDRWEDAVRLKDPDFAKKEGLIRDRVRVLLVERGKPLQSPADAVEVARQAYKDVNERLRAVLPAVRSRTHVPAAGVAGGNVEAPVPKTMKEAISRSLGGG